MPQRHKSPGLSRRIILGTKSYKNTWSKRNLTNKLSNDPPLPTGHSHRIMHGWWTSCPPLPPQNSMTSGQKSGKSSFSPSIASLRLCGKHTSIGPMPPSLKCAGHNFATKKSIPFNRSLKCIEALNSQLEKKISGSIDFHENVDLILPRKGTCLGIYFCPPVLCRRPPSSGQYNIGLLQSRQSSTVIHSNSH